ncbi:hypothetical protein CIG75_16075 [Tumebacillus algifaecis]|uniref:Yip1 domain-containing protein n=1 Tax=Tumebacillus algifaecis TaxID=1214604 RepID=A0A223D4G0_9BACL|nr:hypothetical protein [Tumebacillus algifaecis]ASS76313.1 hypothetical protein CIG75_16075 [Tumebacillus algifaecis]
MLSLLGGLMFRPQETLQKLLQKPDSDLAGRLVNVVTALMMVNLAFYFASEPFFEKQFGIYKWLFVLLLPPVQFLLQRFLFGITSRLGLLMFASDRLPVDPQERKAKWGLLKKYYPYTYYPSVVMSVLAAPLNTTFFSILLVLIGVIYMYLLRVHLLKQVFGISGTVAFWGPVLVELLISFALTIVIFILSFIAVTMFHIAL